MKLLLRITLTVVLIVVAGFYVAINHSEVRQELVCTGHWRDDPSVSDRAFVQLRTYRPWVALWSYGSEGNVKVSTEKRAFASYISHVSRTFDGLLTLYTFHDFDYVKREIGTFRGGYRVANGEITIEFGKDLVFIGVCKP